nr:hypothetical protein HK105_008181 [Polyrhizophydium stewartii]
MGGLVLALAVIDAFGAIGRIPGRALLETFGDQSGWCRVQAVFVQIFAPAATNISLLMALTMVYVVFYKGSARTTEILQPYLVAACVVLTLPAAITLLVHVSESESIIGDADQYCWISARFAPYRILYVYISVWITFAGALVAYIMTWVRLVNMEREIKSMSAVQPKSNRFRTVLAKRMMLFVMAFMLIWTPSTINRIYQAAFNDSIFALSLTHAICNSLEGFINFLIFAFTMRSQIWGSTAANSSSADGTSEINTIPMTVIQSQFDVHEADKVDFVAAFSNPGPAASSTDSFFPRH